MKTLMRAVFGRCAINKTRERTFTFRVTNWNQVLRDAPEAIEQVKRELVHNSVFPDRIDVSQQLFRVYTEKPSMSATEILDILRRFGFDAEFCGINNA